MAYPTHLRGAHRPGHPWHPVWVSWRKMLHRCRSDGLPGYEDITLEDPRWASFPCFAADMGPRLPGYSIDRRDNARGYGPTNCRWASAPEQASNRRTTRFIAHGAITAEATLLDWAEVYDRDPTVLRQRLRAGWDFARAFDTPTRLDFDAGVEAARRSRREGMRRLRRSRQNRPPDCLAT